MKFTYTCKKVTLSDSIKEYAEKKISKLDRYFREDADAIVTFAVEKDHRCVAEITIRSGSTGVEKRCVCIPIDDNFIQEEAYTSNGREIRTAKVRRRMWPVSEQDKADYQAKYGKEKKQDWNIRQELSKAAREALEQRDPALAARLMPALIAALSGKLPREERSLAETLDAALGEGNATLCRRTVKESGADLT